MQDLIMMYLQIAEDFQSSYLKEPIWFLIERTNHMLDKKKVVIGMSGGVDSTVAAFKLKEMGYDVIGITMKVWEDGSPDYVEKEGGCCSLSAIEDARRAAEAIGIPFYVVNFKEVFKQKVITYFLHEYEHGRTPNPCIACNKHIKFDALLRKAHDLGAYYVATGHYSKVEYDESLERYVVRISAEDKKDQTYTFWSLSQDQLKHILTPLGSIESKAEVREIAARFDMNAAGKSDSQEICFIPDDDYARYVRENSDVEIKPGNFVDTNGKVLGQHKGIIYYTIGQRKGLGITFGQPMYVVEIKPETNEVVLGANDKVFSQGLLASNANFIPFETLEGKIEAYAKIRYSAKPAKCTIENAENGHVKVVFEDMQRAVTPGQAVVFYNDEMLVGGATIEASI